MSIHRSILCPTCCRKHLDLRSTYVRSEQLAWVGSAPAATCKEKKVNHTVPAGQHDAYESVCCLNCQETNGRTLANRRGLRCCTAKCFELLNVRRRLHDATHTLASVCRHPIASSQPSWCIAYRAQLSAWVDTIEGNRSPWLLQCSTRPMEDRSGWARGSGGR